MKNLIIVTGGNGRFAQILKKKNKILNLKFLPKNKLNILSTKSIKKSFLKYKPKMILHTAGLSRPMVEHEKNISRSIDSNILGTANLVKVCASLDIKIIYFSTCYVYDGIKGNFKETDPIKPINNYGLSKLGGECSVQMYKNSLILRIQMTEKPFQYEKAYSNLISNFIYHEDLVEILPKIINQFGIINIGGKKQSVYSFAKKLKKKVKKVNIVKKSNTPLNQTMNLKKLKKLI